MMTKKAAFTPEEWALLRVTPSFVAVGVTAADASGLFSAVREALAGAREVMTTLNAGKSIELFSEIAADRSTPKLPDIEALLGEGTNDQRLEHFKSAALERVASTMALVRAKATATEALAYHDLLIRVAERAAHASKEGSFLGFGGVRVSEKERAFIELVRKAAEPR